MKWTDTLPAKPGFYFYKDWNRTVKIVQILPGHRRGTLVGIVDGESIPLNEIAPGDWSSETITLPK